MQAVGQARPLPDWIGWFQAADRNHCPPWEFFAPGDPQPPRAYWQAAALVLSSAEALAGDMRESRRGRG